MENPKGGLGGQLPITGPGNLPPGGTTGQELVKLSNADDDTGWVTGLTLNPESDLRNSNIVTQAAGAGGAHSIALTYVANPWLDAAGNILLPGLYKIVLKVIGNAAFTAPVFMTPSTAFDAVSVLSSDAVAVASNQIIDIASLDIAALPYDTSPGITIPADVTGSVDISQTIFRLAH